MGGYGEETGEGEGKGNLQRDDELGEGGRGGRGEFLDDERPKARVPAESDIVQYTDSRRR